MPLLIASISGGNIPSTPVAVSTTRTSSSIALTFTPSAYIGKGTISYTAVARRQSTGVLTTSTGATSPITISGLASSTAYDVYVFGTTNYGSQSANSNILVVTTSAPPVPPAGPPAPPAGPPVPPPPTPTPNPPEFGGPFPPLPGPFKSVGVNTLIRTTNGLVAADAIMIGDVLVSADIDGFPYDSEQGTTHEAINWSSLDPNINLVETTVVSVRRKTSQIAVAINSDLFSDTHFILITREGVSKFLPAIEVIDTDLIYSYSTNSWSDIIILETVNLPHKVVSINCEPYDMFFTEEMLTHDSNSI